MQLFSGATSVDAAVNTFGRVVEAAYAVVHAEDDGLSIQLFKAVTSVVIDVQVEASHLAAKTVGKAFAAEYVDVHAAAVGSVIQLFKGVTSVDKASTFFGSVVAAL